MRGFGDAASFGPVSAALFKRLAKRTNEQRVVVWLDERRHYTRFVARLRSQTNLPYLVHTFAGSYLELLLELDGHRGDDDPRPLLIHLPGVSAADISSTPLYELHLAGQRDHGPGFCVAIEELLIEAATNNVKPELIAEHKQRLSSLDGPDVLEQADAWLDEQLHDPNSGAVGRLRVMRPSEVLDDLLGERERARLLMPDDANAVLQRFAVWLGVTDEWRDALLSNSSSAEELAAIAASWSMCVEYVDDLGGRRQPRSRLLREIVNLPQGVVATCRELAAHLRKHHLDYYRRIADETETRLAEEVAHARAKDLGQIDTFRFEDAKVLEAALLELDQQRWAVAAEWARMRIHGDSAWLRDDPHRRATWQLILDAAELGLAIVAAGPRLPLPDGIDGAVEHYVQRGAAVDRAHRQLEQRRSDRLDTQMPAFELLRDRLDAMRVAWRGWADAWARDFNEICRTSGFLPSPSLQQRMLFDQVVRESCKQPGVTALFLVDALRYEMAEELAASFGESEGVWLRARLAELPTVTEVGMNALAPVARSGRLSPVVRDKEFAGFRSSGEFQVTDPKARLRAMHERVGGRTPETFDLDGLLAKGRHSLRRKLDRASLVIVYSRELDNAGHGHGLGMFTRILQKLRGAWHLLRSAGVQRFVFTADHGFLLLDDNATIAQPYKRKIDPKRRYVLEPSAAVDYPHEVRVRLSELEYEENERQLVFPETTSVFDTGKRTESFVHGGNSLQERVIPVLTLVHAIPAGGALLRYAVRAEQGGERAGMHCIEARVEVVSEGALDFGGVREVELALQVTDVADTEVELCSVEDGARIERGAVLAQIGQRFKVYFRLRGPSDARGQVELHHPSRVVDVEPCKLERRFAILGTAPPPAPSTSEPEPSNPAPKRLEAKPKHAAWLEQLPAGGVRELFAQLASHGIVTATEAERLLGGTRQLRRFAIEFDDYVQYAPFTVRIETVAGLKQYVREGS